MWRDYEAKMGSQLEITVGVICLDPDIGQRIMEVHRCGKETTEILAQMQDERPVNSISKSLARNSTHCTTPPLPHRHTSCESIVPII